MRFRSVSVIGLGYIGLPTAAIFASRKIPVIGVDVDPRVVETINRGEIHIVEPDLDMVVRAAVSQGYLRAALKAEPGDAFVIAVPTPFRGDNHEPDLTFIDAAARSIAPVLSEGNLVVLESTSPVGATERLADTLAELRPDLTFPQNQGEDSSIRIAHCPERVLPGHILRELVNNDRIVGGMTQKCSAAACELYEIFHEGERMVTNARTAEMCKLTENSFRDTNIAFANELSIICDKLNIDVWELIKLANHHPRVNILQPGPGVGGHCIAVDPWFIVNSAPKESKLIATARCVNDSKPQWVIEKVDKAIKSVLFKDHGKTSKDVTVCCYGISFKPDIDDLRESPALRVAATIMKKHAGSTLIVEPNIKALPDELSGAALVEQDHAYLESDVHVLLVDHREFHSSRPEKGIMIDTRGCWIN